MTPSTTPQIPDFLKDIAIGLPKIFSEAAARGFRMIWDIFMTFLTQNWLWVIVLLIMVLVFSFVDYLMTGRWANLGSVLYSYTYYGILFLIGVIFGPETFANDWIDLILFVVCIVSFLWVRVLLNNSGIRRRR